MKLITCLLLIAALHFVAAAQVNEDITATDGAKLKATYYSPGKPGPGILLLHQCNMDRKSWTGLAHALSKRGIHVLTFDYRGYGETPSSGTRGNLAPDIDTAFEILKSKPGVDKNLLAAGGASCGVNNSIHLARRSGQIKALLLLTGPTTPEGVTFLKENPNLPVYFVDEEGFQSGMESALESNKNSATTTREVSKGWHGVVMFEKDPSLLPLMADWLAKVLKR